MNRTRLDLRTVMATVLAGLAVTAGAEVAPPPKVAVLDVQFESDVPYHDHPAVGLADFLELALLDRGVELFARRELQLVLDERGLTRENWTHPEGGWASTLPWVNYLVKGWIRPLARSPMYTLEISLADAQSGRIVDTWTRDVPNAVSPAAAVGEIADEIAGIVLKGRPQPPPRERMPGFTSSPEMANQFYRGLDHFVRGNPGFAIDCFRRAADNDPQFLLARLWEMRGYEFLGLAEHAALVRQRLQAEQTRQAIDVLGAAADTHATRHVVSLRFINGEGGAFDTDLVEAIRAQVRAQPGLEIFEPGWIRELTDENDLKLRGDFNPLHGLDRRIWLQADFLAALRISGAKPARTVHVTLASLRTGRVEEELRATESDLDALYPAAAAAVARASGSAVGKGAWTPRQEAPFRDYAGAAFFWARYSADDFAVAIERYVCAPQDRMRLLMLYWCYAETEIAQRALLMRRLADSILPAEPQADTWLAYALMQLHALEREAGGAGGPSAAATLAVRFAEFAARYTNGVPARWLDYALGVEALQAGDAARAQSLLNAAVAGLTKPLRAMARQETFPRVGEYVLHPVRTSGFPFLSGRWPEVFVAHLLFRAAHANAMAGDAATARRHLAALDEVLRGAWRTDAPAPSKAPVALYVPPLELLGIQIGLRAEDDRAYQAYVFDHAWLGWTCAPPATHPDDPDRRLMFCGYPHASFGEAMQSLRELVEHPDRPPTIWPAVAAAALTGDAADPFGLGAGIRYLDHFADYLNRHGAGQESPPAPELWQQVFAMLPRVAWSATNADDWASCARAVTRIAASLPEGWAEVRPFFEAVASTPGAEAPVPFTYMPPEPAPLIWPFQTKERLGNPQMNVAYAIAHNGALRALRQGPFGEARYYAETCRAYIQNVAQFIERNREVMRTGFGRDYPAMAFEGEPILRAVRDMQFRLADVAGRGLVRHGDVAGACRVYEEALAVTGIFNDFAFRFALLYRWAEAEHARENDAQAVELLKQIVDAHSRIIVRLHTAPDLRSPYKVGEDAQQVARILLARIRDSVPSAASGEGGNVDAGEHR